MVNGLHHFTSLFGKRVIIKSLLVTVVPTAIVGPIFNERVIEERKGVGFGFNFLLNCSVILSFDLLNNSFVEEKGSLFVLSLDLEILVQKVQELIHTLATGFAQLLQQGLAHQLEAKSLGGCPTGLLIESVLEPSFFI